MNPTINTKNQFPSTNQEEPAKQNYYHQTKQLSPMKNKNLTRIEQQSTMDTDRMQEYLKKEIFKNKYQEDPKNFSVLPQLSNRNISSNIVAFSIAGRQNSEKESFSAENSNFNTPNLLSAKLLKNNKEHITTMSKSPNLINKIDPMKSHPFRHMIFSPYITVEIFQKYLNLTLKGLIYSTRHLKEPSLAFVESKQIKFSKIGNFNSYFI